MRRANPPKRVNTPTEQSRNSSDRIHFAEAHAQVEGQKADGIRDTLANLSNLPSDRELMVKIAEALQTRETILQHIDPYTSDPVLRAQVLRELLRKAELDGPVAPPKHARFAVFLLPRPYQQIIFGDLEEQYPIWLSECGQQKATFLYWWQFLLSTAIVAWPRTRRWRYLLGFALLAPAAAHFLPSGVVWTRVLQRLFSYV